MGVNEYSFVALYNPSDRAQADCRIVLCEQRVAGQQRRTKMRGAQRDEEQNRTEGSEEEEEKKKEDEEQVEEEAEQLTADSSVGQGSDESARGNTASALVCLTSPDVSAKSPLFT
nr:suface antigen 30 [Eimeria intestinalis]